MRSTLIRPASSSHARPRYLLLRSRPKRAQTTFDSATTQDLVDLPRTQSATATCSDLPGSRAALMSQPSDAEPRRCAGLLASSSPTLADCALPGAVGGTSGEMLAGSCNTRPEERAAILEVSARSSGHFLAREPRAFFAHGMADYMCPANWDRATVQDCDHGLALRTRCQVQENRPLPADRPAQRNVSPVLDVCARAPLCGSSQLSIHQTDDGHSEP